MKELLNKYGGEQHLIVPDELKEGMKAELEDIASMQKI